ncbi:methylmalonyl-CoA epimerase [Bacillus sp. Marseille-P3661]|uniref:methylmalonyl-CoA epimerase n=1 Tax=Bacillus sp. Marseille-P3661 TaxID=1936234 RepID=UPI000C81BBBE|nr:methylmalonyl-CoA epimerase [Bacillus sp. Marseille-P3661]
MVKKIDHIGIAVHSIEASLPFYVESLQLTLQGIEEVPSEGVKVAFLKVGESKIELLEPLNSDSPIARYLEKRGEGIHHIALAVDSIEERINEIKEQGIKMINNAAKTGAGGAKIAFMHPKSTGGVLYELCEKQQKEEQ